MVGKDTAAGEIWLARDEYHPSLFCQSALLHPPAWVAGQAPQQLNGQGQLHCSCMARYHPEPHGIWLYHMPLCF